jgi:hypothetical protein
MTEVGMEGMSANDLWLLCFELLAELQSPGLLFLSAVVQLLCKQGVSCDLITWHDRGGH